MQDSVIIEGLAVEAVIGVYDWERTITQRLVFDLEMAWDNSPAADADDITLALDYAEVSSAILSYVSDTSFELIETVAERVCELIITRFGVSEVILKLSKPGAVPEANNVAVKIRRRAAA
ncbi:dihydroneopterin aldolase [Umboniibacter marinipuniceus]|uniref:7,8-dihydroneopterin aldolase n=1 Tax=Umboniibacter marinipuniceus TaxID=569599 RepID=A0A3M0ACG2_9GAMM|nr:dihydroneopterin aldolase [Umboniibacter marinipuniceus]RMA80135.1 dihydroneopterin aldolase [Umboniibacter marinipuniceus]